MDMKHHYICCGFTYFTSKSKHLLLVGLKLGWWLRVRTSGKLNRIVMLAPPRGSGLKA